MITFRIVIHSTLTFIQQAKHKHKGQAWIGGVYIILLAFVLCYIVFETYRLQLIEENTENVITTSALGSLKQDYRELAVNYNIVLNNVLDSYETLCDLTGKNLGLTRNGNHYSGSNPHYDTESSDFVVQTVIFYQVYDNTKEIYSYTFAANDNGTNTNNVNTPQKCMYGNTKTPTGLDVVHTGCYVEYAFPMRICGITQVVKKGTFVTLERN